MAPRVGPAPRVPAHYVQASVVERDGVAIVTLADFEEGAGDTEFAVLRIDGDGSMTEVGRGRGA